MEKILKGLSYGFSRNLGKTDRIIRAVIALAMIASWGGGIVSGILGIILGVLGIMILGTAAVTRCSICYLADVSTIGKEERAELDKRGVAYEAY